MGSAVPRPTGYDLARAMLHEVEMEARRHVANGQEPDSVVLLGIIDSHLNSPDRDTMRLYCVAFLSRCLLGSVPDHKRWDPFQ